MPVVELFFHVNYRFMFLYSSRITQRIHAGHDMCRPKQVCRCSFHNKMSHKIGSTYFVVAFDTNVYGRDGRDDINLNKGKLTEVIVLESYNKSVLVAAPGEMKFLKNKVWTQKYWFNSDWVREQSFPVPDTVLLVDRQRVSTSFHILQKSLLWDEMEENQFHRVLWRNKDGKPVPAPRWKKAAAKCFNLSVSSDSEGDADSSAADKLTALVSKRLGAEEEAKKKAIEKAKKNAEEDAKKKREDEAKKNEEEEAKKNAEEEAKKNVESEADKPTELVPKSVRSSRRSWHDLPMDSDDGDVNPEDFIGFHNLLQHTFGSFRGEGTVTFQCGNLKKNLYSLCSLLYHGKEELCNDVIAVISERLIYLLDNVEIATWLSVIPAIVDIFWAMLQTRKAETCAMLAHLGAVRLLAIQLKSMDGQPDAQLTIMRVLYDLKTMADDANAARDAYDCGLREMILTLIKDGTVKQIRKATGFHLSNDFLRPLLDRSGQFYLTYKLAVRLQAELRLQTIEPCTLAKHWGFHTTQDMEAVLARSLKP